MAVSYRDRVGHGFELLATGLGPYVDRKMSAAFGLGWIREYPRTSTITDPSFLLRAIIGKWERAFASELTKTDRNLVFELRDVRNKWAHNEAFTQDDAYRALDSIGRLLVAVDAPEATEVRRAKKELIRPENGEQTTAPPAPEAPPSRPPARQ